MQGKDLLCLLLLWLCEWLWWLSKGHACSVDLAAQGGLARCYTPSRWGSRQPRLVVRGCGRGNGRSSLTLLTCIYLLADNDTGM